MEHECHFPGCINSVHFFETSDVSKWYSHSCFTKKTLDLHYEELSLMILKSNHCLF
jgi:hypothetical protein